MATSSRDRISVDLQGLKAALLARAEAMHVSPSEVVRQVLSEALQAQPLSHRESTGRRTRRSVTGTQRLSLRMDHMHVLALNDAARRSGLSLGEHVAGLLDGIAALGGEGDRVGSLTALVASNAELSTLSRDIRHLTRLLGRGEVQAARVYRERLDSVGDEVRAHLRLASQALADLRPQRAAGGSVRSIRS
ncbi:hypothetical protein Lcho_0784 [Leptothrix cholodnii SP-6]|jgi:hypothetical protein|uniref:Uncharacterized protein n=1 Tax=Leptothrix cholodnii (strain ATCC 51168 / LMG 8142 / SP-6) TaxID=395495 RepID=B1Y180_LEPCP|nr:hypothetical protein [Leptothrix cholodnii]ACB33057.1 hypothetical protein Lcho_0784 [Leptothrix cholodnii SP-6]